MDEIKKSLDEVIKDVLDKLKNESDSDKRSEKIKELSTLYKFRIDETEAQTEATDKEQRRLMEDKHHAEELALKKEQAANELSAHEQDEEYRKRQEKDQMIDRCVRIGIAVAELMVPLVFYGCWMRHGFEFEKDGTYTSTTFKNLISRLRPTKKS